MIFSLCVCILSKLRKSTEMYTKKIDVEENMSPERRYFKKIQDGFQVLKNILEITMRGSKIRRMCLKEDLRSRRMIANQWIKDQTNVFERGLRSRRMCLKGIKNQTNDCESVDQRSDE